MRLKERFFLMIVKAARKVLEIFGEDKEFNQNALEEKNNVEDESKKIGNKFFGKDSLFDKINEIELEIFPLEKYSLEDYTKYKKRLDELTKESKDFYEDNESKDIYAMKIMSEHYDLEIYKKLYELLEEVKTFKKEKFNYEIGIQILNDFQEYLLKVHYKLIADNSNISLLEKTYNELCSKLNEINNLDIDENTVKQEEMCKLMCECIYVFLKCNSLCQNYFDVSKFKEIFNTEKHVFWSIFIENVNALLKLAQVFKNTKYYQKYENYLKAILNRNNVPYEVLLNESFFNSFVLNEKSIIEFNYYYTVHGNKING